MAKRIPDDLQAVLDRIRERRDAPANHAETLSAHEWHDLYVKDIGTLLAIVEKAGEMEKAAVQDQGWGFHCQLCGSSWDSHGQEFHFDGCTLAAFRAAVAEAVKETT